MGHVNLSKSELIPLIDRLNKYPVGLADNEKLRQILSILFDGREAYVASRFPLEEATLAELVIATGMDEDELLPALNSMADKGLVADMPYQGTTYYLLVPGLIGFFEFTFMKNRTDIPMDKVARLMAEYLEERSANSMAGELLDRKTQLTRALVYEEAIPVTSRVATYESAREIIKEAGYGAAGMCYCRHKKEHQGLKCKRGAPVEGICITLGQAARFLARRGFMEEKSTEELLEILKRAESFNLTHITENVREKPAFICNCCRCCCVLMNGLQMGYKDGTAKTPFLAEVDQQKCDYCGKCMAVCNVKAIRIAKNGDGSKPFRRVGEVDKDVCLGCGACLSACSSGALSLAPRERRHVPPRTHDAMFSWMILERRRFVPLLFSRIRKLARNLYARIRGKGAIRPLHMLDT